VRPLKNIDTVSHRVPSVWNYRLQRWMLTPAVRMTWRVFIPTMLLIGVSVFFLFEETRWVTVKHSLMDLRHSIEQSPEFMVKLVSVDGASDDVDHDIREILPIDLSTSSFDLDLENIRATIVGLDAVKDASVRIRPGGILQVNVNERVPVVVWRTSEALRLLDESGVAIAFLNSRTERPDLPLVVGEKADEHIDEALTIYASAAHLAHRIRGLVRVGERRWDVVLDRQQRILLPSDSPLQAFERVLALSEADNMLQRDISVIDMRISSRPTLRMSKQAREELWHIREINEVEQ